jgi:tetratricopeptide (TPR) repeat protein
MDLITRDGETVMIPARTTELFISFGLFVAIFPCIANDQTVETDTGKKTVRCCGLNLRTEFGHPARMKELKSPVHKAFDDFLVSLNSAKCVDEFDAYLEKVESEFGNAKQRDPYCAGILDELREIANDETRTTRYRDASRQIMFAETLRSKSLNRGAVQQLRKALSQLPEAVPDECVTSIRAESSLAIVLAELGENSEANALTQSAVSKARRKFGKSHHIVADTLFCSGRVQHLAGNPTLSEKCLREAFSITANSPEIDPEVYFGSCLLLADALLAQSKYHETVELMEYLMPQLEGLYDARVDPNCFMGGALYAKSLLKLERFDEAEAVLEKYHSIAENRVGPGPLLLNVLNIYAAILEATDRAEKAEPIRRRIAKYDPIARRELTPGALVVYEALMK